jgi:hypothetical protein
MNKAVILKGSGKNKYYYFIDYPDFRPNLSPREIIQMGSFGGGYFRDIQSSICLDKNKKKKKFKSSEVISEFPKSWWKGIDIPNILTSSVYNKNVNKYGVKCGTSLELWESKGWITEYDCYGWFQWYCRFYNGRRLQGDKGRLEDERQIKRWQGVCGEKGRFRNWLINDIYKKIETDKQEGKNNIKKSKDSIEDYNISPVKRQTLQHWGYKLNKSDFEKRIKKLSS